MGEEGHVMLLLAGGLGCDLRVGRTFRTPQRGFWRQGLAHRQQNPFKKYLRQAFELLTYISGTTC